MNHPLRNNHDCPEVRSALHALADGQLTESEKSMVEAHLDGCTHCHQELDTIRLLGAELRAQLPVHKAPEFLRQRITAVPGSSNVAGRSNYRLRNMPGFAVAGWIVAALALMVIVWQFQSRENFPASAFVKDHTNYLKNRELAQVNMSDPAALEKWFGERVDFHPVVPKMNDATLLGGRVCKVADERVVLAFWAHNDETFTIFTRPDSEALNLDPMPEIAVGGRTMHQSSAEGYSLLLWRENGLLHVLVTDHPQHELPDFAQSLFS